MADVQEGEMEVEVESSQNSKTALNPNPLMALSMWFPQYLNVWLHFAHYCAVGLEIAKKM